MTTVIGVAASARGAANGVATLGSDGKVPTAQLPSTSTGAGEPGVFYPRDYGFVSSASDHTTAIQATINAAMVNGGKVVLPPQTMNVTNLYIDYSRTGWAAQSDNGAPYGYPGIVFEGHGSKTSILKQISGTAGDVLTVSGKHTTAAGPANNNKIVGMVGQRFGIIGASSGGNGLYLRSITNSAFRDLNISLCGGSGIYEAREYFVSGTDDEYNYSNVFENIKIVSCAGWGVEHSGTNAISGLMLVVECIGNTLGGFKVCPSNFTLGYGSNAIGNGVGNAAARGLLVVNSSNTSSQTTAFTCVGFRSEGNSTIGGYEIEFQGSFGSSVKDYNVLCTQGASAFGVGLAGVNVAGLTIGSGYVGLHTATSGWSGQKLFVYGSLAIRPHVEVKPRVDNGAASTLWADIVTLGSSVLPTVGATVDASTIP